MADQLPEFEITNEEGNSIAVDVTSSVLPTGASTSANQTETHTRIGPTNETAPASDTATSGLNGRLQRIAQRLSDIISDFTSGAYQISLKGDTDGTKIGNTNDALKVINSPIDAGDYTTFKSSTEVVLSSDVTYNTLHSVTGSGLFIAASFVGDNDEIEYRVQIDGNTVFEFTGGFLEQVVNTDAMFNAGPFSISNDKKRVYFYPSTPFRFTTSLTFSARRSGKKVKYQLYTYSEE